jgi:hypothetical protein
MYASIRKYSVLPGRVNEWMRSVQEGFVPLVSEVSGFIAYYALEASNDQVVTVSIFDARAGAEESAWRAADWVTQHLASLNRGLTEMTLGQVRVVQINRLAEDTAIAHTPVMSPTGSASHASPQTHSSDDDHGPFYPSVSAGTQR